LSIEKSEATGGDAQVVLQHFVEKQLGFAIIATFSG
jgi:hypothetical protein